MATQNTVTRTFLCFVCVFLVFRYVSNNLYLTGIAFLIVLVAYFQIAATSGHRFRALRNTLLSWIGLACLYLITLTLFTHLRGALFQPVVASIGMSVHVWRISKRPMNLILKRHFVIALSLLAAVWTLINSMPLSSRITYLGFGYDNYGHLAHARMLFQEQRLPWPTNIENFPSHLSTAAQGSASALAFLFGIFDGSGTVFSQITVFLFVSACLPVFAIAMCWMALRSFTTNLMAAITGCVFVSLYLLTGYLSRMWGSGYFASTLAVVLMCCLLIDQLMSDGLRASGLLVGIGLVFLVYALFGAVLFCLVLPFLLKKAKTEISNPHRVGELRTTVSLGLGAFVLSLCAGFTYLLIRRAYSSNHFLVAGGIEELPVGFLVLSGLSLLFSLCLIVGRSKEAQLLLLSSSIGFVIIGGVVWYSKSETGIIAYYPTKVVISVWTALLLAGICLSLTHSFSNVLLLVLVAAALISPAGLVRLSESDSVFSGAFMGTLPRVVSFPIGKADAPVSGPLVMQIASVAQARGKNPLLLSEVYDSELNTRWVNTLMDSWNDGTWSMWITLREMLSSKDYAAADSYMEENEMMVFLVSQNPEFQMIREYLPNSRSAHTVCVTTVQMEIRC